MKSKKSIKNECGKCGSSNLKSKITTFPVHVGERQMNIGLVSVKECQDCLSLQPTLKGQEKIDRATGAFFNLFG